MRPLSSLELGPEVDGSAGANRAPREQLLEPWNTDLEALEAFLREYEASPGTERVYRRECERLVLWAVVEQGKPASSLSRADLESYMAFLANPQPAQRWCGPRAPRDSENWRPFVGPLQQDAVLTAIAAVNSLFKWWTAAGYLRGNPLGLVRQRLRKTSAPLNRAPQERFLDEDMWAATMAAVDTLPCSQDVERASQERARFILSALYLLAPRAGELEAHAMNSFVELRGRWWWSVRGKGRKEAKLPVPEDMVDALVRYRQFLGLPAVPTKADTTPLLLSLRDIQAGLKLKESSAKEAAAHFRRCEPMTARQLNRVLKDLFARAADLLPEHARFKGDKLRAASAHWGRHTSITARVDAGMDARYVQRDARHQDARTTALYTHEEDERWHDESQKLRLPSPPSKKSI